MSERTHGSGPAHEPGPGREPAQRPVRADFEETDADLDARGIVRFGIVLAALIAVSMVLVWLLSAHFKAQEIARDPERSPLAEANAHRPPPEPRLQSEPVADMVALRANEERVLTSYGWADRKAGTARIPIDRAIDILARTGLPVPPPPPPAATAPAGPGGKSGPAPNEATGGATAPGGHVR